jgi:hypothetical protein
MKYFISCFFFCIIAINILIWIKIDYRQKDIETETQIKLLQMAERIEEQDKQIRILRQDMDIFERGFE